MASTQGALPNSRLFLGSAPSALMGQFSGFRRPRLEGRTRREFAWAALPVAASVSGFALGSALRPPGRRHQVCTGLQTQFPPGDAQPGQDWTAQGTWVPAGSESDNDITTWAEVGSECTSGRGTGRSARLPGARSWCWTPGPGTSGALLHRGGAANLSRQQAATQISTAKS